MTYSLRLLVPSGICLALLSLHWPARSDTPPAKQTLATFDGGEITLADYEQVLSRKLLQERVQIAKPGGREALLESLIRYDLLAQEAERRGYAKRPEVINAGYRAAIDRMLAQELKLDPATIPADLVAKAYAEREREFAQPAMRRATQIQVATEAEAKKLIAELRGADRETFSSAAREHNQDPRARNQGGELGWFDKQSSTQRAQPSQVPAALVAEAFKLRSVGDISRKPIAHDGAFSILMLTGDMPAQTKPKALMDAELREGIVKQKEAAALEAVVAQLYDTVKPEVHPELVNAIELPAGEPLDIPEGFAAAPPDPRAPLVTVAPDNY